MTYLEKQSSFVFKSLKPSRSARHFDRVTLEINRVSVGSRRLPQPGSLTSHWETCGRLHKPESWSPEQESPHSQEVITGPCPHYCGPENQAADGNKQGAAKRSSRNQDCVPSLARWCCLKVGLTIYNTKGKDMQWDFARRRPVLHDVFVSE